jgi:hypothetical protein
MSGRGLLISVGAAAIFASGCGSVSARGDDGAVSGAGGDGPAGDGAALTPGPGAALDAGADGPGVGGEPPPVLLPDAAVVPADGPASPRDAPVAPSDAPAPPPDACACTFPHGVGSCVQGACTLSACVGPFGDCNRNPADGCEAPLDGDDRCGGCDRRCNGTTEVCLTAGGVAQCTNPAAPIDRQRWEVPCGGTFPDGQICATLPPGATTCPASGSALVDRLVTFGGADGVPYDVTLRFRGLVEPKSYLAGSSAGDHYYVGGMPGPSGFNVYALTVSSPPQVVYLNADELETHRVFPLDHTKTLRIAGRATVRLQASDPNCGEVRNCRDVTQPVCTPYVIPGLPPDTGYNGQFIQMDVVGVKRAM